MKECLYIAQDYIPNPLLIDNKKFDFRLYFMICGVDKMEAYIAFEGMSRFCTEDYIPPKASNNTIDDEEREMMKMNGYSEDNLMSHLTNYSLNKTSLKFVNNNDFQQKDDGSKRLLSTVMKLMEERGVDIDKFKSDVKDICTKLAYAYRPHLVNNYHKVIGPSDEVNQN